VCGVLRAGEVISLRIHLVDGFSITNHLQVNSAQKLIK